MSQPVKEMLAFVAPRPHHRVKVVRPPVLLREMVAHLFCPQPLETAGDEQPPHSLNPVIHTLFHVSQQSITCLETRHPVPGTWRRLEAEDCCPLHVLVAGVAPVVQELLPQTGYDPTPPRPAAVKASQAKESDFDWLAWRERVAEVLRTASRISADGEALSFTEVSAIAGNFCDTLHMLSPSSAISMDASTRDSFFSMVASATRVFQCPGVTKQFVPLLVKVRSAIDGVAEFHRRFKNLHHHSEKLLAIQRDILNPTAAPKKTRDSRRYKGDDENALYEKFQAAYDKAHSWDHDSISLKAFDEGMRVLDRVMAANTKTWRVRGNSTVSACRTLLVQRAHGIKNVNQRKGRLVSLVQWQKLVEVSEI